MGAKSLTEFRDRIRARLQNAGPGEWIVGGGWDQTLSPVKELPSRWDIDEVTTDHPVFLERVDGHIAVANTRALQLASITVASKDPSGGKIDRDTTGQATGILRETARQAVTAVIPKPNHDNAGKPSRLDCRNWPAAASLPRRTIPIPEIRNFPGMISRSSKKLKGKASSPRASRNGCPSTILCLRCRNTARPIRSRTTCCTPACSRPTWTDPWVRAPPPCSNPTPTTPPIPDCRSRTGCIYSFDERAGERRIPDRLPRHRRQGRTDGAGRLRRRHYQTVWRQDRVGDGSPTRPGRAKLGHSLASGAAPDLRLRIEHAQVTTPLQIAKFKELKVIASMQPTTCSPT